MAKPLAPLVEVVEWRDVPTAPGKPWVWLLTLACGHRVQRKRTRPDRARCPKCAAKEASGG